jgi:NADPH2:quinone reductase
MKAWLLDSFTGLTALHLGEAPEPAPAAGQVVVKLKYAALNPADRYLAEGQYPAQPALPHILGRDGLGLVTEIAPDVKTLCVGDKVLILRGETGVSGPGTFAEKTAVAVDSLVSVPDGWSDEEAAGAPLVYLTAYQALTMWDDLPANSAVLVTGASGGVGVASVQLARAMGHAVIALSRDAAKQARLRELGADFTVNPSDPDWRRLARGAMKGRRVDLAIDNIGGSQLPEVIDTLGQNGRVSCVGRLAGEVPHFNTASLFFRRLRMGGVAVATYGPGPSRAAWEKIVALMAGAGCRPVVDEVFGFGRLKEAFARLTAGPMGKVLLAAGG